MKKSYLMIAAAAGLMLAACSQEDDFVAQNAAAEQGDGAVLFDTYLSNTNTRAGQTGIMTTSTLQKTGFGVFAYKHSVKSSTGKWSTVHASTTPNFMWNQLVGYEASNWTYSPLKYWPNETANDEGAPNSSTSTNEEGVSFFAYAPYVTETTTTNTTNSKKFNETGGTTGITEITSNNQADDPFIHYVVEASSNPSNSVDLLWGTSSGFSYHPVNDDAIVATTAGKPVVDMVKPGIEEKIKFNFQHALARIGMKVVGAFDQVAQGGTLDQFTRVTINEVKVEGKFATDAYLNLNNTTANKAAWYQKDGSTGFKSLETPGTDAAFIVEAIPSSGDTEINPDLAYSAPTTPAALSGVMGVNGSEQNLITLYTKKPENYSPVTFSEFHPVDGTTYYSNNTGTVAVPTYNSTEKLHSFSPDNGYTYDDTPDVNGTPYYKLAPSATAISKKVNEVTTEEKRDYRWYKASTNQYTKEETFGSSDETLCYREDGLTATLAMTGYAASASPYYTLNPSQGYFMIIPAPIASGNDLDVTVTIDYFVTTADPKLNGEYSNINNKISQVVKLKNFTNGKSYMLKLILGLTSVKVEAEVSNWEVETVESNLPMNRD